MSQDKLTPPTPKSKEELIEQRVKEASTKTKSDDPIVQLAWLADGIDLWHRTNGERGHSPAQARRYIISSATRTLYTRQDVKAICEKAIMPDDNDTRGSTQNPNNPKHWTRRTINRNALRREQRQSIDSIIDKWGDDGIV